MSERYGKASACLAEFEKQIATRNAKWSELESFLKLLDLLMEFDEALWLGIVHQMRVSSPNEFTFVLKDGSEVPYRDV